MAKKQSQKDAEAARVRLTKDRTIPPPDFDTALSSGSTLLNLAMTGYPHAGYVKGNYYYLVGDSNSGKTWLCLSALAEAARNPAYDGYRLILDDVEGGVQLNVARHFGRKLADRIEPACTYKGSPWKSEQIEEFYLNLASALDQGPCIYVLDSMDGLSSQDEEKKFIELQKAQKKDKDEGDEVKGSYGDGKAKKNSAMLRQMIPRLEETKSILIVVSQTRDSLTSWIPGQKTRSGGHAPVFYAQTQVWTSVKSRLTKTARDEKRHNGNLCEFHVKRSRYTGHEAKVQVPIYFSSGMDEVGSMVDYLCKEKHWKKAEKGAQVEAHDFDYAGSRERLIHTIEDEGLESRLQSIVAQVWMEVEAESGVERKRRYE